MAYWLNLDRQEIHPFVSPSHADDVEIGLAVSAYALPHAPPLEAT